MISKQALILSLLLSSFVPTTAIAAPRSSSVIKEINWNTDATSHRSQIGQIFSYRCPPNGRVSVIYGSDFYSTGSSICTAAVHAGLITVPAGGIVAIQIQPETILFGTTQSSVRTRSLSSSPSFLFVNPATSAPLTDPKIRIIGWGTDANHQRGRLDQEFSYRCLPNGEISTIYGTDVYSIGSSICTAAVHAGKITVKDGGTVTIRIGSEQNFTGTTRNGVRTRNLRGSGASFTFLL
ncbi:LCCL domain protein [Leptolyngbya sp. NIES-3755]|nr:LCCL domain protein [Leptolyngbya sp. NIES-3755]